MPKQPSGASTVATIMYPPGVYKSSTSAALAAMPPGNAGKWYDAHLIRWVRGRLRPIQGWERIEIGNLEYAWADGTLADFASPLRALHTWSDLQGVERQAFLCEKHLYVREGDHLLDITPVGGIQGPNPTAGGFGDDDYGVGLYGTPRPDQPERRLIGEIWRLRNWGEDLLAMTSSDGRLLRWKPYGAGKPAEAVPNSPRPNRTFEVTAERHVLLFSMAGKPNQFGWCSMEDIEDWNFTSTTNTAGFYEIEPLAKIINAVVARYVVLFWTTAGSFAVSYKGLPYIYGYEYVGAFNAPISGMAPVVYSGNVVWPAPDGFWIFNGNSISSLPCPLLDWFQQVRNERSSRLRMSSVYNGAQSELWFFFPRGPSQSENTDALIYNFDEGWWSQAQLSRSCGYPGNITNYPIMGSIRRVFRHEIGHTYADLPPDPEEPTLQLLPYIMTGSINIEEGSQLMTLRQFIIDSDADIDALEVQFYASKGRHAGATYFTKLAKRPRSQGKIDYRLTGRDFVMKLKSSALLKPWSFGQGKMLLSSRGRRGAG